MMYDLLLMADPDELAVWALPCVCDMLKLNTHTQIIIIKASGPWGLRLTCSAGVLSCHRLTHMSSCIWHSQHTQICSSPHTPLSRSEDTEEVQHLWTFVSWKMGVCFTFIQNYKPITPMASSEIMRWNWYLNKLAAKTVKFLLIIIMLYCNIL